MTQINCILSNITLTFLHISDHQVVIWRCYTRCHWQQQHRKGKVNRGCRPRHRISRALYCSQHRCQDNGTPLHSCGFPGMSIFVVYMLKVGLLRNSVGAQKSMKRTWRRMIAKRTTIGVPLTGNLLEFGRRCQHQTRRGSQYSNFVNFYKVTLTSCEDSLQKFTIETWWLMVSHP